MRKSSCFVAIVCVSLGWSLSACQPQTESAAADESVVVDAAEVAEADASSSAATAATPSETEAEAEGSAPPPADAPAASGVGPVVPNVPSFLATNDLAPLWQADFGHSNDTRPTILNGFYGAEHRHIAVILEKVTQEATQPGVFLVHGRSRYKKNITPFAGTITITSLRRLNVEEELNMPEQANYTASASFTLREEAAAAGAGTYQGTALLDFYRLPSGKLGLVEEMYDSNLPTGGGGLLFRGQWQSLRSGLRQEVTFASYVEAVLPNVMADLYIGDRGEGINPKYAGLDWSDAWENSEWWAKPLKPSLSL